MLHCEVIGDTGWEKKKKKTTKKTTHKPTATKILFIKTKLPTIDQAVCFNKCS